jgi:hypothetical protein
VQVGGQTLDFFEEMYGFGLPWQQFRRFRRFLHRGDVLNTGGDVPILQFNKAWWGRKPLLNLSHAYPGLTASLDCRFACNGSCMEMRECCASLSCDRRTCITERRRMLSVLLGMHNRTLSFDQRTCITERHRILPVLFGMHNRHLGLNGTVERRDPMHSHAALLREACAASSEKDAPPP